MNCFLKILSVVQSWLNKLIVASISVIIFSGVSIAEGRKFARSYLAETMSANQFSLGLFYYNKFDKMDGYYQYLSPGVELEYGAFDKLTASLYFNFNQIISKDNSFDSKPFTLESTSLELRYRFTNEGEEILDPAVMLEFEIGKNVIGYEPKLILSKIIKNFTGVINLTAEYEKETDTDEENSGIELTGGLLYKFTPLLEVGFEFMHHRTYESVFSARLSQATFLGPTINIKTKDFSLAINIIKQISGSPSTKSGLDLFYHENYELSAMLEVEL